MYCHTSSLVTDEIVIHAALELSKNSWLLAIEASEHNRPSLHHVKGGDSSTLLAKLPRLVSSLNTARETGEDRSVL